MKKRRCQVKNMAVCSGQIVRRMTGKKKGDPKFWCCIACAAALSMSGVKLKEVSQ